MDLVYIYGPPAVGKLTVAKELTRLTGYRLFHNHLSIDCVRPVFDFDTEPFWRLVYAIRLAVIEEAATQDVSLIYTSVYSHPEDQPLVASRFEAVERQGGRVCLVRLHCLVSALEQRIQSEDRLGAGKLTSLDRLRQNLQSRKLLELIPGRESLTIDNTDVGPEESARRIAAHYGLPLTG